jgi:DNA-binding NtrC family response regulator
MIKLLVIDDEAQFLSSCRVALAKEGYEVIVVSSETEAIDKIKKEKPQIILLNICLPQIEGLKTLEKIREIDKKAIIVATGVNDSTLAQRAIRRGAINYLGKPIDLEALKRSLKSWEIEIEAGGVTDSDILFLRPDEAGLKKALEVFAKKGYHVRYIGDKDKAEAVQGPLDLLILGVDIPLDGLVEVLLKYKQAYPELPVAVITEQEPTGELIRRIKGYGHYQYIAERLNDYGLILIIYKAVSRYQEKVKIKQEKKPSDYIIIVDDECDICEYTERFLAREGYKVCAMTDPNVVLDQVRALKPSVVLLDVVMPDMDGIELLKKIKKLSPQTSVIMLTGVKDESVVREAIESGASDYIVKPFSLDQLKVTILTHTIKSLQT